MGVLNSSPQKRIAFQSKLLPTGLAEGMNKYSAALGMWRCAASASFRAGQALTLNSSGEVIAFDAAAGSSFLGVAMHDRSNAARSIVVELPVTLPAEGATVSLGYTNLVSGSFALKTSAGAIVTQAGNYTIDLVTGILTHTAASPDLAPGDVRYAWFSYDLTAAQMEQNGRNFWNQLDYPAFQDERITVIEAPAQIYTTEFDPSVVYTITGSTSNVYANSAARFTSASGAELVGHCINIPTAAFPFLGIKLFGQISANS